MDQQMSLFDMAPEEMESASDGMLHVVKDAVSVFQIIDEGVV